MRNCLVAAGILREAQVQAERHRCRFQAARAGHPLGPGPSIDDVVHSLGSSFLHAATAGMGARASLRLSTASSALRALVPPPCMDTPHTKVCIIGGGATPEACQDSS